MDDAAKSALETVQSIVTVLLSWLLLAAISIIISGKLISLRLPMGLSEEAKFEIPLIIFQLKARGEEVITGFLAFIISLALCISFGGNAAYLMFKAQSGVDIGQWNSLCVIASFVSLIVATAICIIVPFLKGSPVVNQSDREDTIRILERQSDDES